MSALSLKISVKIVLRIMFVFWVLAVTVLSVISYPGSNDLLMSIKLTGSGFVIHCVAYFVGKQRGHILGKQRGHILNINYSATDQATHEASTRQAHAEGKGHPGEMRFAVTDVQFHGVKRAEGGGWGSWGTSIGILVDN